MTIDGSGVFTDGVVYYSGTGTLLFSTTGTTNGGSNTSFVDDVVSRIGVGSFTMPVGDISTRNFGSGDVDYAVWGPIDINPVANTTTSVEYFFSNSGLPDWWEHGGNMDATIHHVSDREYWSVSSSEHLANVTLHWKNNLHANGSVCVHSLCDGDNVYTSSDMTVAYWSSTIWRNAGGSAVGSHDNGSLTSGLQIPFGAKSTRIITFASKNDLNPLPVELVKFDATCESNSTLVEWLTVSEINNEMFILEKSNDMKNFFEVARIPGAGSSNIEQSYSFMDKELFAGDNYYRLLQVDFDGRTSIIDPISINCSKEMLNADMIVYPNPFNDKVNIVIEGLIDNEYVIEVYNDLGSVVFVQRYLSSETNFHSVIDLSNLRPAVYSVRLTSKNYVLNKKIVKK